MRVYSYYDFQVCQIQEDDGPIYRARVGDNSLMDIHSIINIIHNTLDNYTIATTFVTIALKIQETCIRRSFPLQQAHGIGQSFLYVT
jgi:hypothetical protein